MASLNDILNLQSLANSGIKTKITCKQEFMRIAEGLIGHSTPKQIQEYEST